MAAASASGERYIWGPLPFEGRRTVDVNISLPVFAGRASLALEASSASSYHSRQGPVDTGYATKGRSTLRRVSTPKASKASAKNPSASNTPQFSGTRSVDLWCLG